MLMLVIDYVTAMTHYFSEQLYLDKTGEAVNSWEEDILLVYTI